MVHLNSSQVHEPAPASLLKSLLLSAFSPAFRLSSLLKKMVMLDANRIVPGAPPPAPLTKSQRKKRKAATASAKTTESVNGASAVTTPDVTTATLAEKQPEDVDAKEDSVAAEPTVTQILEDGQGLEDDGAKPSVIVEYLQKRRKALNKKIVCVSCT